MKLIISVINNNDSNSVIEELMKKGFRLTRLTSMGEFLRMGNTTVLTCVEDEQVDEVFDIIKEHSRTRVLEASHRQSGQYSLLADSLEVKVGGAVAFVLDVEQFVKF